MTLDLTDPASIVAWYRAWSECHGPQLATMARLWPAFAAAIKSAGETLRKDRGE